MKLLLNILFASILGFIYLGVLIMMVAMLFGPILKSLGLLD